MQLFDLYSYGQNPEFSPRESASGQIKKSVRSIGMGGDGAILGNYSLVLGGFKHIPPGYWVHLI
jgi:hypothetical protein